MPATYYADTLNANWKMVTDVTLKQDEDFAKLTRMPSNSILTEQGIAGVLEVSAKAAGAGNISNSRQRLTSPLNSGFITSLAESPGDAISEEAALTMVFGIASRFMLSMADRHALPPPLSLALKCHTKIGAILDWLYDCITHFKQGAKQQVESENALNEFWSSPMNMQQAAEGVGNWTAKKLSRYLNKRPHLRIGEGQSFRFDTRDPILALLKNYTPVKKKRGKST